MTLLADYQARYSLQARTNFSNPQSSSPTTPDTTRETYAAADAGGDFATVCGVEYDSSNPIHVSAGVSLVASKLLVYTLQQDGSWYDAILERLSKWYRLVLGRDRILPTTNSTLIPSTQQPAAPWSDPIVFKYYVGSAPGGPTITDPGNASSLGT